MTIETERLILRPFPLTIPFIDVRYSAIVLCVVATCASVQEEINRIRCSVIMLCRIIRFDSFKLLQLDSKNGHRYIYRLGN